MKEHEVTMMPYMLGSMILHFKLPMPVIDEINKSFHYSDVGYELLGAIIEKASNQSFEDYMKNTFFRQRIRNSRYGHCQHFHFATEKSG